MSGNTPEIITAEQAFKQAKGLYVITQSGDNAAIADMPDNFKAREW